jgi:hypothetical protein
MMILVAQASPGRGLTECRGNNPACQTASTPTPVSWQEEPVAVPISRLRAEGNLLVDEQDRIVRLRGVFISDKGEGGGGPGSWDWVVDPPVDYELAALEVAASPPHVIVPGTNTYGWGASLVQFYFASGPIVRGDSPYLSALDSLVAAAKAHNVYIMLAYRSPEPHDGEPEAPDPNAIEAHRLLTIRYLAEPHYVPVLQAEPHPSHHERPWSMAPWGDLMVGKESLKGLFERMIDVIRKVDPDRLIAIPGSHWGQLIHWQLADPINRDNLLFKANPWGFWDQTDPEEEMHNVKERRYAEVAARYPLVGGELGWTEWNGQSWLDDAKVITDYLEMAGIGWAAWSMRHDHGTESLIKDSGPDWEVAGPHGAYWKALMQTHGTYDGAWAP